MRNTENSYLLSEAFMLQASVATKAPKRCWGLEPTWHFKSVRELKIFFQFFQKLVKSVFAHHYLSYHFTHSLIAPA